MPGLAPCHWELLNETPLFHMNVTVSCETGRSAGNGAIINDQAQFFINISLVIVLAPAVSAFGFVTNILNMIVFSRNGLKDGMAVSLFSLALSETILCLCTSWWGIAFIGVQFHPLDPRVDFDDLFYLSVILIKIFKVLSILLTVYICLERCLCVIWPLKFKNTFTAWRSTVIACSLFLFTFLCAAAKFSFLSIVPMYDPAINGTRLRLHYPESDLRDALMYMENFVVGVGTQGLVLLLTLWTILGLRRSMRFRKTVASRSAGNWRDKKSPPGRNGQERPDSLAKEMRLTRMIIVLATIFFLLRLPDVAATLLTRIHAEVKLKRVDRNLYLTMGIMMNLPTAINASINVFMYHRMSSDFRQTFNQLFCWKLSGGFGTHSTQD